MKIMLTLALLIVLVANSGCHPGAARAVGKAAKPAVKRVAPKLAKKLFGTGSDTRYVLPVSPRRPPYGIGEPSRPILPWHIPASDVSDFRGLNVEATPKGARLDHSKRSNWLDEAEGVSEALMGEPGRIEDLRKWYDSLATDDTRQQSEGRTVGGRRTSR